MNFAEGLYLAALPLTLVIGICLGMWVYTKFLMKPMRKTATEVELLLQEEFCGLKKAN